MFTFGNCGLDIATKIVITPPTNFAKHSSHTFTSNITILLQSYFPNGNRLLKIQTAKVFAVNNTCLYTILVFINNKYCVVALKNFCAAR